jgi:uncharacterized membrane protein YfcA
VHLGPLELAVATAAAFFGALIQGSIGFGLSLVVTPVLGLLAPETLPAAVILAAQPLTALMAVRERGSIDRKGFVEIAIARLPGTAAAALLAAAVSTDQLGIVIGTAVVVAAAMSATAPEFELSSRHRVVAGLFSGFMGTIAAVGGPPLAIAYQRRPGPEIRSTLAMSFLVGGFVSLIALWAVGRVEAEHWALAGVLLPGMGLGLLVARRVHLLLERGWLRPAVLAFAIVSGLAAIVKGLL